LNANAENQFPRISSRKRGRVFRCLAYAVYLLLTGYIIAEFIFSTGYSLGWIEPPEELLILEDTGVLQFDPVYGVRHGPRLTRTAKFQRGIWEYDSTFRGNNQGFCDRDDFHPDRPDGATLRLAVLGDSFTSGRFLDMNWPDRMERLAAETGIQLQLLNFAIDGAGLANWWSILTRHIVPEDYQIDSLVFAVFGDDLSRTFLIEESRNVKQTMGTYTLTWDPETWPATREEANRILIPWEEFILPPAEYDAVRAGTCRPDLPRPWRPRAFSRLIYLLRKGGGRLLPEAEAESLTPVFNDGQQTLILDIQKTARENGWPVHVVFVPGGTLSSRYTAVPGEIREFARLLGAPLINGAAAFDGLTEEEKTDCWLPYDGHWAQPGSDYFARFMLPVLTGTNADILGEGFPRRRRPDEKVKDPPSRSSCGS
jgi:hypothetical protein